MHPLLDAQRQAASQLSTSPRPYQCNQTPDGPFPSYSGRSQICVRNLSQPLALSHSPWAMLLPFRLPRRICRLRATRSRLVACAGGTRNYEGVISRRIDEAAPASRATVTCRKISGSYLGLRYSFWLVGPSEQVLDYYLSVSSRCRVERVE